MHRNSWLLFQRHAQGYFHSGDRVLEIGPERIPSAYQLGVGVDVERWDTLDFPTRPGVTIQITDGYHFPVQDNHYDVVLSGQVIYTVPKVWKWVEELVRITRPGGFVITIAPVSWPFAEAPVDCWRIYPDGMRALYEEAGLEVIVAEWGSPELEPIMRKLPRRWNRVDLWQRISPPLLLLRERLGARPSTNRLLSGVDAVHVGNQSLRLPLFGAFDTIAIGRKSI